MKAKTAWSAGKVMMVIFFNHVGFIHQYVFPEKTTVTRMFIFRSWSNFYTLLQKKKKKKARKIAFLMCSFIRTMLAHKSFVRYSISWPPKESNSFLIPHICLISHPATSGYFLKGKLTCAGGVLSRIWRRRRLWKLCANELRKMGWISFLRSGLTTGASASQSRDHISKKPT